MVAIKMKPEMDKFFCRASAISSGYPELQSSKPLTASFIDSGGADTFDGSKQWHIKYAFEKVEGSGFKCKICGQIKKHVRNHYLKHFPEHHECHLCRRTYTRKDNLNSHLKRDHFQRVKTPPDPYHRVRRLTKRVHDCQTLTCFTPDLYPPINFPSSIPTSAHPILSHPSPPPSPMDLSIRSNSVPSLTSTSETDFSNNPPNALKPFFSFSLRATPKPLHSFTIFK